MIWTDLLSIIRSLRRQYIFILLLWIRSKCW